MSIYVNNKMRIKRNADQHNDMKRLLDAKIFTEFSQILVISAILGYKQNQYKPIEKAHSDGVLMQFFSTKDCDIMDFIAFAHKKHQAIIKDDEKYDIFSSFANGGFPILLKSLEVPDGDISKDDARKAMKKYYRLLLTDGFIDLQENEEKELEQDLFK